MGEKRGEWERLSSKIVHQNAYYAVREDAVIKPDGSKGTYHVVACKGASFIVAVDDSQRVYLIGQHRYPVNIYSIEVPSGGTEGKDPLAAAKRELKEETGLEASTWEALGVIHPSTGVIEENNYVYLATNLKPSGKNRQKEEGINKILRVSFTKAFQMVKDGKITDGESIASLTLAALKLGLR